MMNDTLVAALVRRRSEMLDWLESQRPDIDEEQKHLSNGSQEQAYWHHGYQAALADVVESLMAAEGVDVIPGRLN